MLAVESEKTSNSRAGEIGGADPAGVNANANPRTIPTPVPVDPQAHAPRLKPKTAYTNTTLEPHPYTTYIPVPDAAPHPQNQDIQTLPLLTPAERAWLAAQHDLAREPDYWRPVRWLELGERMYGEEEGTLHDGDDGKDGERGAQGGRETQGIAKGNAAWESVSLSRLQCDMNIHRFKTMAWVLEVRVHFHAERPTAELARSATPMFPARGIACLGGTKRLAA
ncbi:hypothetical protein K438DRAFT_244782 [Mycena galopus ATCC 62051]|nr:hypothetical protein K438DRAFT_244782 [Mycena galopus ATCC 62051]